MNLILWGLLFFSISVSLFYIVPWLWGSCINKSSYIILLWVLLSSNAPIDEAFSLIICVPDSIVIARTKKRTRPHYTTR